MPTTPDPRRHTVWATSILPTPPAPLAGETESGTPPTTAPPTTPAPEAPTDGPPPRGHQNEPAPTTEPPSTPPADAPTHSTTPAAQEHNPAPTVASPTTPAADTHRPTPPAPDHNPAPTTAPPSAPPTDAPTQSGGQGGAELGSGTAGGGQGAPGVARGLGFAAARALSGAEPGAGGGGGAGSGYDGGGWYGGGGGPGAGGYGGPGGAADPGPGAGAGTGADGERDGVRHGPGPLRALRIGVTAWADPRTWRELAFLLVAAPLSLVAFVALATATFASGLLAITLVGIPMFALTLTAARHYGAAERSLAEGLLGERIGPPPPLRQRRAGVLGRVWAMLTDRAGWKAVLHIVVTLPLRVLGIYGTLLALAISAMMASYPLIWALAGPSQFGDAYMDTWPEALALCAAGLLGLAMVPWLLRLVVLPDRILTRALLGPGAMAERVRDLEETRAHAVDDSAATLRRIERDLHDGTQARLVALAMQLDMAREELASAPDSGGTAQARAMLDTAHRNATEAIGELREVTRRIHPPALDRGLDTALATLAARSAVPVAVRTHLPTRPSAAVETIAYFCVAELLTNVAKHSGATRASVEATVVGPVLYLRVTDDGRGGAVPEPGGGLAGLSERARTIDGHMSVSSPVGGPTVVTIDLPLQT